MVDRKASAAQQKSQESSFLPELASNLARDTRRRYIVGSKAHRLVENTHRLFPLQMVMTTELQRGISAEHVTRLILLTDLLRRGLFGSSPPSGQDAGSSVKPTLRIG